MLSEDEFLAYAKGWGLPTPGQEYVVATRSTEPSRRVGGRRKRNTPVRFASQRMGCVIQAESGTVEGLFVREWEYLQRAHPELWDQPVSVPLVINNRAGAFQRIPYTPDYLELRPERPAVIECKTAEQVELLARERPKDWRYEGGRGYYGPAATFFAELGLDHEVWIPDVRGPLRASNIDLLLATRWAPTPANAHGLRKRICMYLTTTPIASLTTLCDALKLPNATMALLGLDEGWLYAPLDQFLLSRPQDALFSLDQICFERGLEALAIWRTSHPGSWSSNALPDLRGAMVMLERHRAVLGESQQNYAPRSVRRWRKRLRDGFGQVHALLPKARLGNRLLRIPEAQEKILRGSIRKHHANSTAQSISSSYKEYLLDFEEKRTAGELNESDVAVSLPTYRDRIRRVDKENLAETRGGKRAAHAAAEPVDRDHCAAPACRPFEVAHVDHYLGDRFLSLRLSGGQCWSARPWITILRDSTNEVLAMALGFRPPSRKVLSEVLRDCVRRHGRLPRMIFSDGGSEFNSIFYEATLASYGVHKEARPSGAPRFGGELEREFGTIKTKVLWRGRGSTRNDARNRSVSPSHRGNKLAEQELIDHYDELNDALFGQFNTHVRGEQLTSPDLIAADGLAMYPMSGILVEYDRAFLIATSIDAPRKSYKVDRTRGIQILGRWFWTPKLAVFDRRGVQVRLDPWDEYLVYAHLDGAWTCCRSRGASSYENRDLVAVMARTILRLDARTEHAQAKKASDLALARRLRERDRVLSVEAEAALPDDGVARADHTLPDDLPSYDVSWSDR